MTDPARPYLFPPWASIVTLVIGIGIGYLARPQDRWHFDQMPTGNGLSLPIRVDRKTGETEIFSMVETVGDSVGWRRLEKR